MTEEDGAPSYDDYQGFLRTAIQRYWERKGSSRVTFLALLLATRQAWAVALDKTFDVETGRKALTGAAGLTAVAILVRAFLGGPLGLLLTGASAVSLVALYGKNQKDIWRKVSHIRGVVDDYEDRFKALEAKIEGGDFGPDDRVLMIDGLLGRFLDELDDVPPPEPEEEPEEESRSTFAAHVAKQRADEEARARGDDADERADEAED